MNEICVTSKKQGKRALAKVKPSGNPVRDQLRQSGLFVKLIGKLARRIEAVQPPPHDAELARSWIKGIRREKRLLQRSVRASKAGKRGRALKLARRSGKVGVKNGTKARLLGATACAGSS